MIQIMKCEELQGLTKNREFKLSQCDQKGLQKEMESGLELTGKFEIKFQKGQNQMTEDLEY